jgi:large subunit ribosomal protein L1
MKKDSKRLKEIKSLIIKEVYNLDEGIGLLKKVATAKFIESTEVHIALNIDPKYANQQLRTSLILPHGIGKEKRIAVFTDLDSAKEALEMGATIAGSDDLLEEISSGIINFEVLITTPQLMPTLAKVGKILGPKGLMPSPKSGTVSQNLKETIAEFKKGKLEYRADKTGIVHINFGKSSFSEENLKENLLAVYTSIERNKPSGVKGRFFKSCNICTTMSPSIQLEINSLKEKLIKN